MGPVTGTDSCPGEVGSASAAAGWSACGGASGTVDDDGCGVGWVTFSPPAVSNRAASSTTSADSPFVDNMTPSTDLRTKFRIVIWWQSGRDLNARSGTDPNQQEACRRTQRGV